MASPEFSLQKNLYHRIESFIPSKAREAAVAIVLIHGTELHQFGTGTLLRVADQSFIVTAAHVVKDARQYDKSLCLPRTDGSFTQLHGDWMCSSEGQYGTTSDPFDIAVLRLDSSIVNGLTNASFLRLGDISFSEDLSDGIFCLLGYPTLWSQPSTNANRGLEVKVLQYTTYAFEGPVDALSEYQARFHLLLSAGLEGSADIEGNPCCFSDRSGAPAEFPRGLGGISGCSVWILGNNNKPLQDWRREDAKIVAVQTGVYHDRQIIKATRWVAVSTLLHEAFPELRPAMALWRVS